MNRIDELVDIISKAQDAYYNGEETNMSDQEFDHYWDELTKLDPNNAILHKVGKDSGSAFDKVKHMMHMFSQNKATDPVEFRKWVNDHKEKEYLVEYKCDGSSIELQYENGIFKRAITRGNGNIGDDVTCNISKSKNVPKTLKDIDFTGAVRGEVVLLHNDFNKYFKDKANCRNAANGIMKRKDSEDACYLSVIVYDCFRVIDNFETEFGKLEWMKNNGFRVVETKIMSNPEDIIEYRDRLSTSRFSEVDYDIDGIVIKSVKVDMDDVARDRPNKQIAFKFILSEQPTVVRSVEWSVNSKTRTPVAICDPTYLCGTTVKRANICNIGLIKKMGLKIGSRVMMVKRGEIIPKIERVIDTPADAIDIEFPTNCEHCNSKLTITDTQIYCPNRECPNTKIHRIIKWCSVNKIYGIGESVAISLYESGIKTIKDLYNASKEDIAKAILSEKNAIKIKANIDKTKKIPVAKFLAGYDMDDIGEATVKEICKATKPTCLYDLLNVSQDELCRYSGFSEISSGKICQQFEYNKEELMELSKIITVEMPMESTNENGAPWLGDKIICITGELKTMSRQQAADEIEKVGGKLASSVSRNTNFLVTNDPNGNSSKLITARKLSIPIIDEEQFIYLLKGTF